MMWNMKKWSRWKEQEKEKRKMKEEEHGRFFFFFLLWTVLIPRCRTSSVNSRCAAKGTTTGRKILITPVCQFGQKIFFQRQSFLYYFFKYFDKCEDILAPVLHPEVCWTQYWSYCSFRHSLHSYSANVNTNYDFTLSKIFCPNTHNFKLNPRNTNKHEPEYRLINLNNVSTM